MVGKHGYCITFEPLKQLNDKGLWELLDAIQDEGECRGWGSWWWECSCFTPSSTDPNRYDPTHKALRRYMT